MLIQRELEYFQLRQEILFVFEIIYQKIIPILRSKSRIPADCVRTAFVIDVIICLIGSWILYHWLSSMRSSIFFFLLEILALKSPTVPLDTSTTNTQGCCVHNGIRSVVRASEGPSLDRAVCVLQGERTPCGEVCVTSFSPPVTPLTHWFWN
jgi:hypothetical protein